ncbi:FeS cluster assembly protein SufD [bacterium HR33]|nr:FeS cluster assembly protein SufD [bacterium HR33]
MSVIQKPEAESALDPRERYLAAYDDLRRERAGEPAWLSQRREAGLEEFRKAGFPTTRQEAWRFTNVQPVLRTPFGLFERDSRFQVSDRELGALIGGTTPGQVVVLVNGIFRPDLSTLKGLPKGVIATGLAQALASDGAAIEEHLARYARDSANPFTALNTALFRDGAFILVPRGTVLEQPIQIVCLAVPGGEPLMWHLRHLIVVEENAKAAVVESYQSLGGGVYLTNAVTEFVLGDNADAHYCRIQYESDQAYQLATTHSVQGRDSRLVSCSVAFGSALARHDINAVMGGSGGYLILDGLTVIGGRQHVDHHTTLDHAQPHCESHELFNGIFDGHSRGVFNGRIIVRPGAQRTDSKQTNNNILLSPDARADSQPQLEIYADDVKCTHGSTTGPLDPAAIFYLRSRGLSQAQARHALTYGFSAEVLNQIDLAEIRSALDRLVQARLMAAGEGRAVA